MKKILLFMVVLSLGIVGCSKKYEDSNGNDNYNLQTITDYNIIHRDITASGLTYQEKNIGFIHSSKYKSKNFNGVEQIFLTDFIIPSDITLYIGHMSVEKGNFKLVVINNDEIIKEIPIDSFNEEFHFDNIKGTFSVHVAGESAAFDFYIDIQ